ncbi:MAG: hypothetical protein P1V20_26255, partial [Verrucomicrobiales bacterium]|nr:hypothetical protein [Verrucomicrobiales bacterium]
AYPPVHWRCLWSEFSSLKFTERISNPFYTNYAAQLLRKKHSEPPGAIDTRTGDNPVAGCNEGTDKGSADDWIVVIP